MRKLSQMIWTLDGGHLQATSGSKSATHHNQYPERRHKSGSQKDCHEVCSTARRANSYSWPVAATSLLEQVTIQKGRENLRCDQSSASVEQPVRGAVVD